MPSLRNSLRGACIAAGTLIVPAIGIVAAAALFLAASPSASAGSRARAPLVDAGPRVPGLILDIRYAGNDNFVGRPIAGYRAPVCWLTIQATDALARAQAMVAPFGLGLKVFDCFRPQRAVDDFVAWAEDPADTRQKAQYYPDVAKSDLFDLGYIASRSGHSRGSTIDVTLVDAATGAELDMGSDWDLFDPLSWPTSPVPDQEARANRALLQTTMRAAGFRPFDKEWWHFTLDGEPFPDTYFDQPVESNTPD